MATACCKTIGLAHEKISLHQLFVKEELLQRFFCFGVNCSFMWRIVVQSNMCEQVWLHLRGNIQQRIITITKKICKKHPEQWMGTLLADKYGKHAAHHTANSNHTSTCQSWSLKPTNKAQHFYFHAITKCFWKNSAWRGVAFSFCF